MRWMCSIAATRATSSAKSTPPCSIGVDVLAEQHDFARAGVGESPCLLKHRRHRTRNFRAARVGHDAICAELVAAFLDGQERRRRGAAARSERREFLERRQAGFDGLLGGAREEAGQPVIRLRSDHDINRRRAADDFVALGLRDAARDGDDRLLAGAFLQAADLGIDLLARPFANVAGVEDDDVGFFGRRRARVAIRLHQLAHAFAVVDVHLTAEGLDEKALGFAHGAPAGW